MSSCGAGRRTHTHKDTLPRGGGSDAGLKPAGIVTQPPTHTPQTQTHRHTQTHYTHAHTCVVSVETRIADIVPFSYMGVTGISVLAFQDITGAVAMSYDQCRPMPEMQPPGTQPLLSAAESVREMLYPALHTGSCKLSATNNNDASAPPREHLWYPGSLPRGHLRQRGGVWMK